MTNSTMTCERFNDQLLAYMEREDDDATRNALERHAASCSECGSLLAELKQISVDAAKLPELEPSRDLWSGIATRIEAQVVPIGAGATEASTGSRARVRVWIRSAAVAASLVAAAGIGYVARGRVAPSAESPLTSPVAELPDIPADTSVQVAIAPSANSSATPSVARERATVAGGAITTAPAAQTRPLEVQLAARTVAALAADYDREIARLQALINERRNQLDPATVAIIEKNLQVIDTAIVESKKAIARDPASGFLIQSLNESLRSKVELMRTAALLPSRT